MATICTVTTDKFEPAIYNIGSRIDYIENIAIQNQIEINKNKKIIKRRNWIGHKTKRKSNRY